MKIEPNNLTKTDNPQDTHVNNSSNSTIYQNSKRKIGKICRAINRPSNEYNPNSTVSSISNYINGTQFLNRILYSELSAFIYGLQDDEREVFISNIDILQSYISSAKGNIDIEIQNAVIKFCDHAALANQQKELLSNERIAKIADAQKNIENKYNLLDNEIQRLTDSNFNVSQSLSDAETKYDDLNKKIAAAEEEYLSTVKSTQRDYISIFGVFSAIIITFVGGLTFTTSVMDGINLASRYRIVFIVSLIGFIVINLIHCLLDFLTNTSNPMHKSDTLNIKNKGLKNITKNFFSRSRLKKSNLRRVNVVLVAILILDTILFFLDEGTEYFERIFDSIKKIINMF